MRTSVAEKLRQVPGGPMSPLELDYCSALRKICRAALAGKLPFPVVMGKLRTDLLEIERTDFDLDAAVAGGYRPSIQKMDDLKAVRRKAPLGPDERALLEDMDGFLDFAVRNGLGFHSVLMVVGHDANVLAAYGYDLRRALTESFRPKSEGWAKKNAEPVGEAEEPLG